MGRTSEMSTSMASGVAGLLDSSMGSGFVSASAGCSSRVVRVVGRSLGLGASPGLRFLFDNGSPPRLVPGERFFWMITSSGLRGERAT